MKLFSHKLSLLFAFLACNFMLFGQSISGFVYDESNNPIPYAKVYFKDRGNYELDENEQSGAITDIEGKFFLGCRTGVHTLIFTCFGFEDLEVQITVDQVETTVQNVYLKQIVQEFEGVSVTTKRKNMGWMIVQNVIDHKKEMIRQLDSYTCEIYIKGVETSNRKKKVEESSETDANEPVDVFQEEEDKLKEKLRQESNLKMIEINLTKHFQYPKDIKEIRTGYETVGRPSQVYYKSTVGGEFNFYRSLVTKNDLHLGPIVSPLHPSGILSYKYRLTDVLTEGTDTIYMVKITPRSVGNSTLSGFLYIKKHDWVLTKVDLAMHKGNLKVYDDFRIIQEFEQVDSLWLINKQTFEYKTKYGKETILGTTTVNYSDYQINPVFPEKFFSNELGITTEEAYERDSSYWDAIRPMPLTLEEQRSKFVQDSIHAIYTSKEYLDSVDAVYNKITFLKVAFLGVGRMNREKKTRWFFPSVASLVKPVSIGGLRFGLDVDYNKKYENQQRIYFSTFFTVGYNNLDLRGGVSAFHYYNPKKLASYRVSINKDARMIYSNNAISSLLDRQNIYQDVGLTARHYMELFNGLYLYNSVAFNQRSQFSLDYKFVKWFDDEFENTEPIQFDQYNALRTHFYVSYVPAQKYMTEPDRKVVLGSAWPRFSFGWLKGWNQVLNSVVDFDYLYASVRQSFQVRTFGESKYNLTVGQFVNQDSVHLIDRKYFRQADKNKWLALAFVNPMHTFQNLDSSYETKDLYLQGHYSHHFNGAIVNKIPFMKKTGIKSVVGAGFLFLPEYDNYFYTEGYIGVERIFKILKERIRIGTYLIVSTQNNTFKFPDDSQPRHVKFAISFDLIQNNANDFNF